MPRICNILAILQNVSGQAHEYVLVGFFTAGIIRSQHNVTRINHNVTQTHAHTQTLFIANTISIQFCLLIISLIIYISMCSVILVASAVWSVGATQIVAGHDYCKNILQSRLLTFPAYFHETSGREYISLHRIVDSAFYVHSIVEIYKIPSSETQSNSYTNVCVGFRESLSHTVRSSSADDEVAYVKIVYNKTIVTGIVRVDTNCWQATRSLVSCNATFMSLPGSMLSPAFVYTPMTPTFWMYFQDKYFFHHGWVTRVILRAYEHSFPSEWISKLRMTAITELEIRGNTWKNPKILLGHLPRLKIINLSQNNIGTLPSDTFMHLKALTAVILSHNNMTSLPHFPRWTKYLHLSDQKVKHGFSLSHTDIPKLNYLEEIYLDHTYMREGVEVLFQLPNLKTLYLNGCWLFQIKDRHHSTMRSELIQLNLAHNQLAILPVKIFSKLQLLSDLYLQHNFFQYCPEDAFQSLINLQKLDLSNNNMTSISKRCLQKLQALNFLDLSSNNLHLLDKSAFTNLYSLQNLDLSHNSLLVLDSQIFLKLENLKALNLSFNSISQEPVLGDVKMQYLDLSHNKLTKISNLTTYIKSIILLDLSWNNVSEVDFQKIKEVDLSHNLLPYIPENMWKQFTTLKGLQANGIPFHCCQDSEAHCHDNLQALKDIVCNLHMTESVTCFIDEETQVVPLTALMHTNSLCSCGLHVRASFGVFIVFFIVYGL